MKSENKKTKPLPNVARRGPKPNPDTRNNLVRIGMRMFHKTGYTATGVKDIVDAAQVPKGSFYNHFESKEAFGKEAIDFYFESGFVTLHELLGDHRLPPLDRLRNFFEAMTRSYRSSGYAKGCMLGNFSLEIADHSDAIRGQLAVHFKTWSGLFESCLAEAQKSGAVANRQSASLLARFLVNSWEGALVRMRAEKSDVPLKEFVEVVFGSLLR